MPELGRGIEPEGDGFLRLGQRFSRRVGVRGTAGQFWHLANKRLVLVAPVNDDFVSVHRRSPPQPVPQDHGADLPDLIELRVLPVPLKVDQLDNSFTAEDMMTASGPFDETEMDEKAS